MPSPNRLAYSPASERIQNLILVGWGDPRNTVIALVSIVIAVVLAKVIFDNWQAARAVKDHLDGVISQARHQDVPPATPSPYANRPRRVSQG